MEKGGSTSSLFGRSISVSTTGNTGRYNWGRMSCVLI